MVEALLTQALAALLGGILGYLTVCIILWSLTDDQ
jgi:hypothetical protein